MKLLLHTCCAPCLIYPLESLRKQKIEVTGFYYNPNIHPVAEYKNRRRAVVDFTSKAKVEIIYPEYIPSEFLSAVQQKEDKSQRCSVCWSLRLRKTAQFAKINGFYSFSTTLLVSPFQDQELLKKIGNEITEQEGIYFYYEDFRAGFRKAHQDARTLGLYCQKYCGCIYSMKPQTYGTK
jgi:hypothetical protein